MGYGPTDGYFSMECSRETEYYEDSQSVKRQYFDCDVYVYDHETEEEKEIELEMAGVNMMGADVDDFAVHSESEQTREPDLRAEFEGRCMIEGIEKRNSLMCYESQSR